MSLQNHPKAQLVLHGGETFEGYSFGYEESVGGEVVFATGMVGYPESLTDPSYHGQIVVMTSPMIGNYGVPRVEEDCFGLTKFFESIDGQIYVTAVVVQEYCDMPDHWEMFESLGSWLKRHKIPGMMMVDTRSIVLKLRDMGTALGKLIVAGNDVPFVDPNTRNLVAEVSRRERRTYGHGTLVILVIDMGVKLNTLRCLLRYDVTLIVVPHDHDITTEAYDGLFISNGPGNPQTCTATIRNVRWALQQSKPIFGICMGNQMLALAAGGKTYKMKYGHRGQNQPCRCTVDNRVVITTQNHGFAVDYDSLNAEEWEVYFANPNDSSNEGLRHRSKPFYSVQFHPEGRCGPQDTEYLFEDFIARVKSARLRELMYVKPRKVLVLGAGGIVIAQAGEFDYSGSQCLKALREEGIETVLVNPNIATVQTDSEMADRIYFVPLTAEAVERVIEKERPDGIMLAWGGQTALNCGLALDKAGVLKRYRVQVLGTPVSVIAVTEDRELFRDALLQINEQVATSAAVTSVEEALAVRASIGYPMMIRAAYTLGGQGSGIVHNDTELQHKVQVALATAPQVLLEQSVAGWKEIEYEVVRDIYDNCITVCNMENVDPMGVHTGESIVVAPSQTLSNDEYHMLRSTSIKIIRHLGIIGECNIQYGLEPHSHRYVVIEVNARLSRSSALASKATGYPLAHVAANIALGKGLFEIVNGVTKTTMACFEPSLDYIVVKMPRWDLAKFNMVSEEIGSMMKSVGEVMAIGRTFEEGLQKAIRMVDPSYDGFDVPARYDSPPNANVASLPTSNDHSDSNSDKNNSDNAHSWDYMQHIIHPTPLRIFALCRALQRGHSVEELHQLTRITRFFLHKLERLVQLQRTVRARYASGGAALTDMPAQTLRELKGHGFSDAQLARYTNSTVEQVRAHRRALQVLPWVKQIDTLAGEVPAAQCCYLYTTYNAQSDDVDFDERMYVVLGCGVYRIGNSVEFDYAGVLVARELRRLGNKVIMINYNPETVSTDYDECDRLYFDEVSEETVLDVLYKEKARGVVISLGGQIVQNMALSLKQQGVPILGTDPDNIDRAEDRNKFSRMCDELGVPQPEWVSATSVSEVHAFCAREGFPALVRPSYVLSGSAMAVIASREDVDRYLREASLVSGRYPVVVSKYYENAMEYDVDIVAHHGRVLCYAICEHIENAGVHSGDATMFLPPQNTPKTVMKRIYDTVTQISAKLDVTGPMNVQFLLTKEGQLRVIEANVRSSRSVPFVSKTLGISFPAMMVSAFLAQPEDHLVPIKRAKMTHIGCKASMFSFNRLAGADPISGVEMASTGEVGVFGRQAQEVFLKAMLCQGMRIPHKGVFVEGDADVGAVEGLGGALQSLAQRLPIYCTDATGAVLAAKGVPHTVLARRGDAAAAPGAKRITSEAANNRDVEEKEARATDGTRHTVADTKDEHDGIASSSAMQATRVTYEDAVAARSMFDLVIQLRDKKKDFMLRRCTRQTATPDYWIRRLAVDYGIPLITEPNVAKLFCEAITSAAAQTMEVEPFRFYVPKIYVKVENNNCAALRSQRVGLLITNNNASKVLALRLAEAHLDLTCFHAYLGGSNIAAVEEAFGALSVPVEVVDLRCEIADAAFDLVMCQSYDPGSFNWHLSKLAWHIYGKCLLLAMVDRGMTTVAQSSKQSKKEIGFEQYVQMYAPHILVYNAWRDSRLMEDFTSEEDQLEYLRAHGVATPLSPRRCKDAAAKRAQQGHPIATNGDNHKHTANHTNPVDVKSINMDTMNANSSMNNYHNGSDTEEDDYDGNDGEPAATFESRNEDAAKAHTESGSALKRASRAGEVHNSVCGITHYCRNLAALPQPTYTKSLRDCQETPEFVSLTYRAARCVNVNGVEVTPLLALQMTNEIAGRNGVGVSRTREGAMYEAPGMRLLATGLRYLYDVCFDDVSAELFKTYSSHVAQQLAVGQYSQKHTQSAVEAVRFLTAEVSGVVELELNRGDIIFLKLSHVTNAVGRRVRRNLVTAEEQEEVFQQGNGSFSDVQW